MRRAIVFVGLAACAVSTGDEAGAKPTPLASIPAGSYLRCGACDKRDQNTIALHAFKIDRDEVTIDQYNACVKAKKCAPVKLPPKEASAGNSPITRVRWQDAADYCKFVGRRLPTEAEWERAAHGPGSPEKGQPHYGKDACHDLVIGGFGGQKCKVKYDGPNDVALANGKEPGGGYWDSATPTPDDHTRIFDLYGNVAEWTADWDAFPGNAAYYFKPQIKTDPKGADLGTARVVLGGSFADGKGAEAGDRRAEDPKKGYKDVGFRCAAD
jgi:sulfatase modifying factor 1